MEYYSVIKNHEALALVTAMTNLNSVVPKERSQTPNTTYCTISFARSIQNRRVPGDRKDWWLPDGREEWRAATNRLLFAVMKTFWNWMAVRVVLQYEAIQATEFCTLKWFHWARAGGTGA